MQITFQMPSFFDPRDEAAALWEKHLRASVDRVKAAGTEIRLKPSSAYPNFNELGARYLNDFDVLGCMQEAEKEGADGIVDYCFFDPALWPARQLLNVPVVGGAEASMHLASYLGRKFAIVTPQAVYAPAMEDAMQQYGLALNALSHRPVRAIGKTEEGIFVSLATGKTDELADLFLPVARACIEDGADVIIIGCGVLGVVLSEAAGIKEIDGVPVISQAVASIKAIEALASLRAAGLSFKSKQGLWGVS
jgi:allantoin racemase